MKAQKLRTYAVVGDEAGPECGMEDIMCGFSHIALAILFHGFLFQFIFDTVDIGMMWNLCSDNNGHHAS